MKLIASDYDGTLNRNRIVCREDIDAIAAWRKAGNLFGLVTGRGFPGAKHEMDHYGITVDFYICNNGSAIFDGEENLIAATTGNPAVLKPLVEAIRQANGERAAISGGKERRCVILDPERDGGPGEQWISFDKLHTLPYAFTQVDTNFPSDEPAAAKLTAFVNTNYGQYVHAHQNGTNVDITPVGVSKPNGILQYIEKMGISKEQVSVIGDNTNDLEMIHAFSGFAVASGNPYVISQASKIYESVGALIQDLL